MTAHARAAGALGALLIAATVCPRGGRAEAAPPFEGNLLIVTVDGLRADRLGRAGYLRAGRSITPSLDALAGRGAYFKRVWVQTPDGARSLGSILTSRHPTDVAWGRPSAARPRLLAANETLFEQLAATGRQTIGVFAHAGFAPELGLNQGVVEWANESAPRAAADGDDDDALVARVVARLKQAAAARERFALWTHLVLSAPHCASATQPAASEAAVEYDAAVASVDRAVGVLLGALRELGLADTTAVVIAGVHGHACGEHGRAQGHDLFEEQLRVPLIVTVPGIAPMTVDVPAAGIDLAPTLLELVGRASPDRFQGGSLLAHVRNLGSPDDKVRPVQAELTPSARTPQRATMLVVDGFKLIHRGRGGRFELYSLREDRGEQHDLVADPNYRVAFETLRRRLTEFERRARPKPRHDAANN